MDYNFIIIKGRSGLKLKEPGRGRARAVLTASEAARRLRRSRRQIYRLMVGGELSPARKALGEWLIDESAVAALERRPLARAPLPQRLGPLFPEHRLQDLNAGRDKILVLSRVLESGTAKDAAWAERRYGRRAVIRFLEEDGARLLGPRSLRLWSLRYGAAPKPLPDWRRGYAVA
ncbi:MAG: helix-turn-helix domain-containing protein [Elusimicrobia bacterium]|nr:helix-turn-helix domain-containing protein [Elusimicrobiota bacterium]